jgi:Autographiviridae endonuclease VII
LKLCIKCNQSKDLKEFGIQSIKPDGLNSYCKSCMQTYQLKYKYNISSEQYEQMFADQEYRCKICEIEPTNAVLFVDHCHDTGKIRGLICSPCNLALGHLKDSAWLCERAAKYLRTTSGAA